MLILCRRVFLGRVNVPGLGVNLRSSPPRVQYLVAALAAAPQAGPAFCQIANDGGAWGPSAGRFTGQEPALPEPG